MGFRLARVAGVSAALATAATMAATGWGDSEPALLTASGGPLVVAEPAAPAAIPMRHGCFRHSSYPAAWTAAQQTNRPILVYVTSPACPHCTRMIGETYHESNVNRFVADSFESVYVDRMEQPALISKLHVRLYPTTIIVAPNNKVIDVIEGYVDSLTFSRRLQTTLAAQAGATQTR